MIKLNSDLGEGFGVYKMGNEELIMPHIQMANVACGFHAGDPLTIQKTVRLALKYGVEVGAHPSYPDLVGFGRRSLACSNDEIEAFVLYQVGALKAMVESEGGSLSYVKPHGALYNDMMKNEEIFSSICKAVSKFDALKLMMLSTAKNEHFSSLASQWNVELIYEVFADRAYTNEGTLVPRSQQGAVLHDASEVVKRLEQLQEKGSLKSIEGKEIKLQTHSLCVHGDNPEAIELIKNLKAHLR